MSIEAERLKQQVSNTHKRLMKESLHQIEVILGVVEFMTPSNESNLQEVHRMVRKRILDTGNDGIKELHSKIDTLRIKEKDGITEVVLFEQD